MLKSPENKFEKVNFVNLTMGALDIVGAHSSVTNILKALGFQQQEIAYSIKKVMCCCIRGTHYVFCMRNKAWSQPSFLSCWRPTCHSASWTPCLIQVSGVLKGFIMKLLFRKLKWWCLKKNYYYWYHHYCHYDGCNRPYLVTILRNWLYW